MFLRANPTMITKDLFEQTIHEVIARRIVIEQTKGLLIEKRESKLAETL